MSKFCSNCGKEVKEKDSFCSNCGSPTTGIVKKPGKGISIAGMVLGIIACTWALLELCSVDSIKLEMFKLYLTHSKTIASVMGFATGYTLIIIPIVGLPLSISGMKKQKTSINKAGLILNTIGLSISAIIFIYILTFI